MVIEKYLTDWLLLIEDRIKALENINNNQNVDNIVNTLEIKKDTPNVQYNITINNTIDSIQIDFNLDELGQ